MPAKFCSECGCRLVTGDLGGRLCPRCDGVVGYVARRRWPIFWWTLADVVPFPIFLAGLAGWAGRIMGRSVLCGFSAAALLHRPAISAIRPAFPAAHYPSGRRFVSGRSSGVEHNLAKVGVGRSNRLARSIFI